MVIPAVIPAAIPAVISALGVAPVKGMRFCPVDELYLDHAGGRADRAFLVVSGVRDGRAALLLTARTAALLRVTARWDPEREVLRLEFPGGGVACDRVRYGARVRTRMYDGREVAGRIVGGPVAEALSGFLGREVWLLRPDPGVRGADDAPVTLMSTASLAAVASATGVPALNPRRFRMTLTVTGTEPWQEERWAGRAIAVGGCVLRIGPPVPRCVVTTRNPEVGDVDARVLHALARLRGREDLCFGVWCDVVRPGRVRRGDALRPAPDDITP